MGRTQDVREDILPDLLPVLNPFLYGVSKMETDVDAGKPVFFRGIG